MIQKKFKFIIFLLGFTLFVSNQKAAELVLNLYLPVTKLKEHNQIISKILLVKKRVQLTQTISKDLWQPWDLKPFFLKAYNENQTISTQDANYVLLPVEFATVRTFYTQMQNTDSTILDIAWVAPKDITYSTPPKRSYRVGKFIKDGRNQELTISFSNFLESQWGTVFNQLQFFFQSAKPTPSEKIPEKSVDLSSYKKELDSIIEQTRTTNILNIYPIDYFEHKIPNQYRQELKEYFILKALKRILEGKFDDVNAILWLNSSNAGQEPFKSLEKETFDKFLDMLIGKGADINEEYEGWYPISYAALDGNINFVKSLLSRGSRTDLKKDILLYFIPQDNLSLLHLALNAHTKNLNMIRFLLTTNTPREGALDTAQQLLQKATNQNDIDFYQEAIKLLEQDLKLKKGELKKEIKKTFDMKQKEKEKIWSETVKDHGFSSIEYRGGYFFVEGANLMQGERKEPNLDTYHSIGQDKRMEQARKKKILEQHEKLLAGQYKIHLMPTNDNIDQVFNDLLALVAQNKDLQKIINSIKIKSEYEKTEEEATSDPDDVFPRIVVYPASGKENVQKALNIIYERFKDTQGLNIRPRFNAKLTDLIYVAQGDGGDKIKQKFQKYFEQPDMIYYDAQKIPPAEPNRDYYLRHPKTQEPIIAIR